MSKRYLIAWSLILAAFIPLQCNAYFEMVPAASDVAKQSEAFHVVGRGDYTKIVTGFGTKVPLWDAMNLLAPKDWRVVAFDEVVKKTEVSWTEGASWDETLKKISNDHDIFCVLNWDKKAIVISSRPLADTVSAKLMEKKGKETQAGEKVLDHDQRTVPDKEVNKPKKLTPQQYFYFEVVTLKVKDRITLKQALLNLLPDGWSVNIPEGMPYLAEVDIRSQRIKAINDLISPINLMAQVEMKNKILTIISKTN